eukprot:1750795-Pyramimonas_sp.AAC.1
MAGTWTLAPTMKATPTTSTSTTNTWGATPPPVSDELPRWASGRRQPGPKRVAFIVGASVH